MDQFYLEPWRWNRQAKLIFADDNKKHYTCSDFTDTVEVPYSLQKVTVA